MKSHRTIQAVTTSIVLCTSARPTATLLAAIAIGVAGGCSGIERADRDRRPISAGIVDRATPSMMRGTIASETIMLGYEPVVVRGFGLVVNLDGTGSRDVDPTLRAHMIATASRHGVGSSRYGMRGISPEDLINSPNTAVVIVEAVIPPGAKEGTKFDVRVHADPRTGTSSLEGGVLYTTELRPGSPLIGRGEGFALAEARGEIFVNPFAESGSPEGDSVNRLTGRILDGGVVVRDMPLKLQLVNPSHRLAQNIQSSINARFPQERRQKDRTAHGQSDELIQLTVPPSYQDRTEEFIQLVRHTTISVARADAIAHQVRNILLDNPAQFESASWRWQSLGDPSRSVIRELYDYPEELPRRAALRAGARIGDPLVIPHLISMASHSDSIDARLEAIDLLSEMPRNPRIDFALRDLIDDEKVDVRLSAYEAMLKRDDSTIRRRRISDRFVIDVIESSKPMVYITQTGQPTIAIFGKDLSLRNAVTVTAWSGRLIVDKDPQYDFVNVYYRGPDDISGSAHTAEPRLDEFVYFLGHRTTVEQPEPGLGLSYAQTVGALHRLWRQKAIEADFKADQDRILAAIQRQEEVAPIIDRPDFATDPDDPAGRPDGFDPSIFHQGDEPTGSLPVDPFGPRPGDSQPTGQSPGTDQPPPPPPPTLPPRADTIGDGH